MITADIERYLDTAIEMKANGHTRPIAQNLTSRHVITFEHRASGVTGPDCHHSETFIRETEQAVRDLFNLITDVKTTLEGVQSNTEWISCGQQLGFRMYAPDQEERNRINSAISDLDLHHAICPRHERVQKERELNPLPELTPRQPITRSMTHGASSHRRCTSRCIHCHSKYHHSEDHHLPLTIPAMPTLPVPHADVIRRPDRPLKQKDVLELPTLPLATTLATRQRRRRRRDTIALHAIDASTLVRAITLRKKDQITTDSIQETITT